jgi:hypothetical protein
MKLTPEQLQNYVALAGAILGAGGTLVGTLKGVFDLIKPDHGLTDEQINQIEQAGIEDSQRRLAERTDMGTSDA